MARDMIDQATAKRKAGVKTLASPKAKVAKPPIDIPRLNNMTMGSALWPLVSSQDIDDLAAQTGVKMSAGIDKSKIASDIHAAFDNSISYFGFGDNRPSSSSLKKWFDSVHSKSDSLLKLLGFDDSGSTLAAHELMYAPRGGHPFPVLQAGVSNLTEAFILSGVEIPLYPSLPEEAQELKGKKAVFDISFNPANGQSSIDLMRQDSRILAIQLLRASPWIIALIVKMSHQMALFYSENLGPGGRKKDAFQANIFASLIAPYKEMTGQSPTARIDKKRDPDAPAVKWTKALFELILKRLTALKHPPAQEAIESVRALTNLQPATIADHIEKGRGAAKRHDARVKKARQENGFHEN